MLLLRDYHAVAAIILIEFLLAVSYAVLLLIALVSTTSFSSTCGMLVMLFLRNYVVARGEIIVERGQMALNVVVCLANVRKGLYIGELRDLILGDAILLVEFLNPSYMV